MEILSNVLQILLEYLVPLAIVTILGYLMKKVTPILEDKTIKSIINILVDAAEQVYKAGHGEDKLNYVLQQAQVWLKQYNINIDMEKLRALVEAEVMKMNLEKSLVDNTQTAE